MIAVGEARARPTVWRPMTIGPGPTWTSSIQDAPSLGQGLQALCPVFPYINIDVVISPPRLAWYSKHIPARELVLQTAVAHGFGDLNAVQRYNFTHCMDVVCIFCNLDAQAWSRMY